MAKFTIEVQDERPGTNRIEEVHITADSKQKAVMDRHRHVEAEFGEPEGLSGFAVRW